MTRIDEILSSAEDRKLLNERQARETFRSVFLVNGVFVIKRFEIPLHVNNYRKPWIIEDKALRRLNGDCAPRTCGFIEKTIGDKHVAWLGKDYIPGETKDRFNDDDIPQVARLMARLHRHMIITDDANVHNFLLSDDNRMIFVDLGRARLFIMRSPWFYMNVGWELAKLRREGFNWNAVHWQQFKPLYFQDLACPAPTRFVIVICCAAAVILRMIRKVLQCKSPWR
jgi:Lipopolysaccharide kinase (Kdo/WaaP) family